MELAVLEVGVRRQVMKSAFRKLRAAAVVAAAAAIGGCGAAGREHVHVSWTFGGTDCVTAGVRSIQVSMDGVSVPGQFACQDGGGRASPGADIGTFIPGPYTMVLNGLDASGTLIYYAVATFTLERGGTKSLAMDLTSTRGTLQLGWTFDGQSCAQAGVTSVRVKVGDFRFPEVDCSSGGVDGASLPALLPGTYPIDIDGIKGGQVAFNLSNVMAEVPAGQTRLVTADLPASDPASAGAQVQWTFATLSCADGKVDAVRAFVDGVQDPVDHPCTTRGVDQGVIARVTAGTRGVRLQALRANTVVYETYAPVPVSFANGQNTQLAVDVPSTSPGVGGAKLVWGGDLCSGPSLVRITYTITPPIGPPFGGGSTCGDSSGATGVEICSPTAAGCSGRGLAVGKVRIDATAIVIDGIVRKSVTYYLAVPNADENTASVTF
jgi:hypothetical protein